MNQQPVTQQELDRLHTAWESAPQSRSFAPLADAYHRAGRHEEAIELLRSGTARHPDYLSALVLLADCYVALQRSEEASALFERVLSEDEENVRALEYQATQSIQQGALHKAAAIVEKLRQIDPWDATIRRLSAQLQQSPATREPSAVDEPAAATPAGRIRLPAAAQPLPSDAPMHRPTTAADVEAARHRDQLSTLTLAQIYESQGYLQKALTIYERLLQQHPGNAQVSQRLDELRRRLAGVDGSAHREPEPLSHEQSPDGAWAAPSTSAAQQISAPSPTGWRLVDEKSLGALQPPAMQHRPAVEATASAGMEASANAAAGRDEDFQRFLRYVRSLGR